MAPRAVSKRGRISSGRILLTTVLPDRSRVTPLNSFVFSWRHSAGEPLPAATAAATDGIAMSRFLLENELKQ